MAESWFALSAADQREALAVAAAQSGWPAYLLEKDIWVVWALEALGADKQLLASLTFKVGTSLSKAYGLIERFFEDVDLTLNIQHLWPGVDLVPAANPTQAQACRKAVDRRLKQGLAQTPQPPFQRAVDEAGVPAELVLQEAVSGRRQPPTIVLRHQPLIQSPDSSAGYVRPTVLL